MKKVKKQQPLKLSYKQRYKNQKKTIRQLRIQLDASECNKELLSIEVKELKQKCEALEVDLQMSNNVKQMYFNALDAQIELDKIKKPLWKRVLNRD